MQWARAQCLLREPRDHGRTQGMKCRCVNDNLYEWEVLVGGFSKDDPAEAGLARDLERVGKVRTAPRCPRGVPTHPQSLASCAAPRHAAVYCLIPGRALRWLVC